MVWSRSAAKACGTGKHYLRWRKQGFLCPQEKTQMREHHYCKVLLYPARYHDLAPARSSQSHFSIIYRFLWRKEKYKDGNSDLPLARPSRNTLCLRSCGQEAVQVPYVQFGGEALALKGGGSTEKWGRKVSTGDGHEQDHPRCSTELAAVLVPVGYQVEGMDSWEDCRVLLPRVSTPCSWALSKGSDEREGKRKLSWAQDGLPHQVMDAAYSQSPIPLGAPDLAWEDIAQLQREPLVAVEASPVSPMATHQVSVNSARTQPYSRMYLCCMNMMFHTPSLTQKQYWLELHTFPVCCSSGVRQQRPGARQPGLWRTDCFRKQEVHFDRGTS